MRLGQPVQHAIGGKAGDAVDAPRLEPGEQRGRGKARVDPDHGDVAEALPGAIDDIEDDIQRTVRGAD
nr:hypothetical protein [Cereibacter azotoformans]